jgi:hypothetical protein
MLPLSFPIALRIKSSSFSFGLNKKSSCGFSDAGVVGVVLTPPALTAKVSDSETPSSELKSARRVFVVARVRSSGFTCSVSFHQRSLSARSIRGEAVSNDTQEARGAAEVHVVSTCSGFCSSVPIRVPHVVLDSKVASEGCGRRWISLEVCACRLLIRGGGNGIGSTAECPRVCGRESLPRLAC